ncbi:WD40-repeat-containing domain protein [Suillus fuscotomentosus]|uniref:WD40-repeat-containing domain protein n=1 Tax=Suillus fuscotomentosus TaxID=1912939 RepID=A0AAD4HND2_9AGAM|nr:WD40-repeat-containing domain protein [Suillus fuscotomentosus]KAG1902847.1 WD40-repeat-containing domain protein [Suillus fuscotomentosus]
MNASLLNPFTVTHPTAVQTSLVSGASFARFDPTGKFVAAGRSDGSAAIWDLDTRAVIRWCEGHVKAVTSIDWSRNSRYVLTSSKDWNVIIWDLASPVDPPQRYNTIRFDAPVVSAYFHPRNSRIVLALLSTGEAYVVDSRKEHRARVELCEALSEDDDDERARSIMTTARFDPSGRHVFVGTSTGNVLVFNSRMKIMVARHRITGAGSMKSLEFAKVGRRFATNSSDRTIRQFILPTYPSPIVGAECAGLETELEPTHRFNDPISKVSWHAMSYSPDGEWLAGGAADPATHKIYIWDISNDGQFATALDGGREPLIDIHWHPQASRLASTTNQGSVLIWHCPSPERWGAFAGGFEEADENVIYEEGESEFDIENEVELAMRKKLQEDEAIDILGGVDDLVDHKMNGVAGDPGDEDLEWADDEPDDDWQGWRLKVIMVDDDDAY